MSWARILAPLSGAREDEMVLKAAAALAEPFEAELGATYAPVDPSDLMPWTGDGFIGGAQVAALDSLRTAAAEGERLARGRFDASPYAHKVFASLESPVWSCLCMEARMADVVVFGPEAARGRGPLVEAFQQVLMDERRPVLVTRRDIQAGGVAVIAWDGGREATRAARAAVPWLCKASRAVILAATHATPRQFEPARLRDYLTGRGVAAEIETLPQAGDAAPILLSAAASLGADLLVAGAFGHPRFQQFIFGGVTRGLMQADAGPSLFLSH